MNLRGKQKLLQTAIVKSGFVIKIATDQFYSADQHRMITGYRLKTPVFMYSQKFKEWRISDYEILHTYSMVDLIFCLIEIWQSCQEWKNVQDRTKL